MLTRVQTVRPMQAFYRPVAPIRFSALSALQKRHVLYGGTFDPVHQGHVGMVEAVVSQLGAERVLIIPTGRPPHKQGRDIARFGDRFAMLKAAFGHLQQALLSRVEQRRKSDDDYTLGTLRKLFKVDRLEQVGFSIPFIIGTDSLASLHTWGGAKELVENLLFIVFKREGETIPRQVSIEGQAVPLAVEAITTQVPNVSSTEIRQKLAQGVPAVDLVPDLPEGVARLIDQKKLYRAPKGEGKYGSVFFVLCGGRR